MIIGVNQNTFYSAALRAHAGAKARLARVTSISAPENQHREQSQVRIIVSRRGFTTTHWYACADLLLGARTRVPF
jgi:hypothetical protein